MSRNPQAVLDVLEFYTENMVSSGVTPSSSRRDLMLMEGASRDTPSTTTSHQQQQPSGPIISERRSSHSSLSGDNNIRQQRRPSIPERSPIEGAGANNRSNNIGGDRLIPPRGLGSASSGSLYQQQQRPAYGESATSLDWTVASTSIDSRMGNMKLSTSNVASNNSLQQSRDRIDNGGNSSPNPGRQRTQYDETRQIASSRDRLGPSTNASNASLSSSVSSKCFLAARLFATHINTLQNHYHYLTNHSNQNRARQLQLLERNLQRSLACQHSPSLKSWLNSKR